jgi:uncharacterized protein
MRTEDMRFNVAQLIKGPRGACRRYELDEQIDHLDPGLKPIRPLQGSVALLRTTQGILVTGSLRTRLQVECRRCLEPYEADVQIDLEEEFLPSIRIDGAPIDEVPAEDRDEALLIDADHILDLKEVVRQDLWLQLPMEGVCRPDCAGLCPRCGGNRNLGECNCEEAPIDPRWAALQALFPSELDSQERSD